MKKRTLAILLIIPFIISLLTFVSIKILDNQVAVDILGIEWDYQDNEGFQVDDKGYELKAKAIVDPNLILANGNNLIWYTKKVNETDDEFARIDEENGKFYLHAEKPGEVEVVCSNERGSKSKHFMATIFEGGAMVINPLRKGSGSSVSSTKYYGLYDYDNGSKKKASFGLTSTSFIDGGGKSDKNELIECSPNVTYENGTVSILSTGESFITLQEPDHHYRATYKFHVIDGVNVYSYSDLLNGTNKSKEGENIVLQVNLESLKNTYIVDTTGKYTNEKLASSKDNTEVFGNFDFASQTFSFDSEYYTFPTTYDSSYIDQYNTEKNANVSKDSVSGIHLRKGLYGNGFTINMNGLCYPNFGEIDKFTGKRVPKKKSEAKNGEGYDYFYGPLPFVAVGDMVTFPLVTALGQDNCGIYIDDDNVVIDDVKLSNVDEVDNLFNLSYTGSIIDVKGKNVKIKNSVLSNGKVCVRAYDSDNLLIDNCILKNSGEFTLLLGSDNKDSYDTTRRVQGEGIDKSYTEFFDDLDQNKTDTADGILNAFLNATMNGTLKESDYKSKLEMIQKYLDNDKSISTYASNITVNNTFFGRSGVFSIAFESLFNGPLLYGGIPSMLTNLLGSFLNAPLPNKLGGTSKPVHLTLKGDTRFYDWKDIDSIDVSSLIEENISRTLASMDMGDKKVTIDDIFPMKTALKKQAGNKNLIYTKDAKNYVNTSIAYYGGGLNNSKVDIQSDTTYNTYSDETKVSLLDETIENNQGGGLSSLFVDCVIVTIGTHPFRFITNSSEEKSNPKLFDKVPAIDGLKKHNQEVTL